jgi:serine/threonine protein kinase
MNRLLPAFEFKMVIAANDFGAVYLANQRSLERDVAIKILAPQVSEEAEFRHSFETTARTMAKLNHPNLIGVYDSGCVEGMLYFVMEFVPGKSLDRSSRGQCVELEQALRLVEGICAGLAHAHDHGVVHGNLNPTNILLNQKAAPKIGNFGLSHAGKAADPGSSSFSAPEVITHQTGATRSSDIYSVGAILYELITGQPHTATALPPSSLSKCGPALDAIWLHATHPIPSQRFPDLRSLSKELPALLKTPRTPIKAVIPASQKLAVGVPAPTPPGTALLPVKHQVGFNWTLVRNLFIIAGLLLAIWVTNEYYETKGTRQAKENQEALAKNAAQEKANAEARQRARQNENRPAQPDLTIPSRPTLPDSNLENPSESLARLRKKLASGDRSEMPKGSSHIGDNDYFLVTEPLTWPEAAWFAEQHGGHLAVPNLTADLTWLVRNVSSDQGIWIGAARSDRQSWTLADGLSWLPKTEPGGTGPFLAADKRGFLRTAGTKERLPFVIQWHRDGTNPGTLEANLASTRKSLNSPKPVFPPGTRVFENRYYLFVTRPVSWREAVALAEKSGGHLVVASGVGEATALAEMTNDLVAPKGIWLGGFRKGDQWVWITGEPWKTPKWTTDAATDLATSALIARPGKGWDALSLSATPSGFIIEWSSDRKSQPATPPGGTSPGGDPSALAARAKELLIAAERKRSEQLAANARSFSWGLDVWQRGLPKSGQAKWNDHLNRLKSSATQSRIPTAIPRSSDIELSPQMLEIAQACSRKQDQIDAEFLSEAEKIRSAFVLKLRESVTQAENSGQLPLAQSLGDTLAEATHLEPWVRALGIEPKPANPSPVAKVKERESFRDQDNDPKPKKDAVPSDPLIE